MTPLRLQRRHAAAIAQAQRRDRPILFSAPMIRALLDGRKTETRRVLKPQPQPFMVKDGTTTRECDVGLMHIEGDPWPRITLGRVVTPQEVRCRPGMLLWVRETWKPHSIYADMKPRDMPQAKTFYRTDDAYAPSNTPWITSIHMPRWASRITLLVREVRVERVQGITEAAAIAEGCQPHANSQTIDCDTPDLRDDFRRLWNSLHARDGYGWYANPWCVVTRFEAIRGNIDSPDVQRRAGQQREARDE